MNNFHEYSVFFIHCSSNKASPQDKYRLRGIKTKQFLFIFLKIDALLLDHEGAIHRARVDGEDILPHKAKKEKLQAADEKNGQKDRRRARCEKQGWSDQLE